MKFWVPQLECSSKPDVEGHARLENKRHSVLTVGGAWTIYEIAVRFQGHYRKIAGHLSGFVLLALIYFQYPAYILSGEMASQLKYQNEFVHAQSIAELIKDILHEEETFYEIIKTYY